MTAFKFDARFKSNLLSNGGTCKIEISYETVQPAVQPATDADDVTFTSARKKFSFRQDSSSDDMDTQQCAALLRQAVEEKKRDWNVSIGQTK